jgi:hypothetical protein
MTKQIQSQKSTPPLDTLESILLHKVSLLYVALYRRVDKFPKRARYTIGKRLEDTLLEVTELLFLAYSKQGASKLLIINKADILLKKFNLLVRIAHKTKALPETGYIEIEIMRTEIGKIIGGWIRKQKLPQSME